MRAMCHLLCVACFLCAASFASAAQPDEVANAFGGQLMIQVAPTVVHFRSSPEHANHSWAVGAELLRPSRWLAGYSYFNNSFDQKCHYLYAGRWWPISDRRSGWYAKLTGGLISGYRDPFENKIPLNHDGLAPGLIPGVGYKADRFSMQLNLLGGAGLTLTFGYDLVR